MKHATNSRITTTSVAVKRGAIFASSKNCDAFYGQLEVLVIFVQFA